jgi:hypothetical protein
MSSGFRKLIGNFVIEMVVYGVLLVAYFFLVLRLLDDPLQALFLSSLQWYAIVGLVLIVVQAVLLETVTSVMMRLLGLDQLD